MTERGYRSYFGREAQARRNRMSVVARGLRVIEDNRGVLGPEAADRLSRRIVGGWAAREITDMVQIQLDTQKERALIEIPEEKGE